MKASELRVGDVLSSPYMNETVLGITDDGWVRTRSGNVILENHPGNLQYQLTRWHITVTRDGQVVHGGGGS